ncbi:MAG: MBL fold metallo-hydrolase [Flavobacteriaceae bacterium]|nr:MBL fold metallo-hydrolase [Flavobacteriaceae bacterium]
MKIHQIINSFHLSNTYVLELSQKQVVLIDVGNSDRIKSWLISNKMEVKSVILTHEHSDHCHGLNELYKMSKFELYCSHMCALNIKNSKQNISRYIDELTTFEVEIDNIRIVNDGETLEILGQNFLFIETPGHSPGSICIVTDDKVFTGDTILNNIKTPLNLPHSSKKDYLKSIDKLKSYLNLGMTIYPGHDSPFRFKSLNELKIYG